MTRFIRTTRAAPSLSWLAMSVAAATLAACSPGADDERSPLELNPEASSAAPEAGIAAAPRDRADAAPQSRPAPGADEAAIAAAGRNAQGSAARAELRPTEGHMTSGVVEFRALDDGTLIIGVEVAELTPGMHGFHIHENGDCSAPDASTAGDHYAPEGHPHGGPEDERHHLGDLGNIEADGDGIADTEIRSNELTLMGAHGIARRAAVVHSGADDLASQPSGGSGDPVACGVIEIVEPDNLRAAVPERADR